MSDNASLNLQRFYPLELEILSVEAGEGQRVFRMRSNSTSSQCQHCHTASEKYHGTYQRLVQDIPIFFARYGWISMHVSIVAKIPTAPQHLLPKRSTGSSATAVA